MLSPEIQILLDKARSAIEASAYTEAIELYQSAASMLPSNQSSQEGRIVEAEINNGLGKAYYRLEEIKECKKYTERALEASKATGDKEQEAIALTYLGIVYNRLEEFTSALGFLMKAHVVNEELENKRRSATILGNIAVIYIRLADYPRALEFLNKTLSISDELGNQKDKAQALGNIGTLYMYLSDYHKSIEFSKKSLELNRELGKKHEAALQLGNIGAAYGHLKDYEMALKYHKEALEVNKDLGFKFGMVYNLGNIGTAYLKFGVFSKAMDFLTQSEALAKEIKATQPLCSFLESMGTVLMQMDPPDFKNSEKKLKEALELARSNKFRLEESEILMTLSDLFRLQERWKEADEYFQRYHEVSTEIFSLEAKKQAEKFLIEREIQEKEKAEAVDRAAKEAKHDATESLLKRVLPAQIAERMLEGDEQIADYHSSTSILFADIQGFTSFTADIPPYLLLQLLHSVFTRFDTIMKDCGCTKIKTVGDGYLAVAGAPDACDDHAERMIKAAQRMIEPIDIPAEIEAFLPDDASLNIRIGIHLGPVVAGVVGQDAFGYDIYSDAVNIASRMETTGEAGRIHVSADFMRHLLSRFAMTKQDHEYQFEKRGEIEVKGKGRMKTFFINV